MNEGTFNDPQKSTVQKHNDYKPKETRYPGRSYCHLNPKPLNPECNPGNSSLKAKVLKIGCKSNLLVRI